MSITFLNVFRRRLNVALWGTTAIMCGLGIGTNPVSAQELQWDSANGVWDSTVPGNRPWVALGGAGGPLNFVDGRNVTFNQGSPGVVTVEGAVRPTNLTFGTTGYTIGADATGSIDFQMGGIITVTPNDAGDLVDATIAAPLSGSEDITKDGPGRLELTGDSSARTGALAISAGDVLLTGPVNYGGPISLAATTVLDANGGTVGGLVTNNGGTVEIGGTTFSTGITVNSGAATVEASSSVTSLTNSGGTVTIDSGQTLTGNVTNAAGAGTSTNNGTITGNVTVEDGSFVNNDGVAMAPSSIDGELAVSGGVFNANADSEVTDTDVLVDGGQLIANGGTFGDGTDQTITVDRNDLAMTAGTLTVDVDTTADVTNSGGTVTIGSGVTLTGDVTHTDDGTANAFTTTSDGTVNGQLSIADGEFIANATSNTFDDDIEITGTGRLTANGGRFGLEDPMNAGVADEAAAITTSDTATFAVEANTTLGSVTNDGGSVTIGMNDRLDVITLSNTANAGTTTNAGIVSGDLQVAGGEFIAAANSNTLDGDITISDGTITAAGGQFGAEVAMTGVADDMAAFTVETDGTLAFTANTVAASVSNEGGTVTIGDAMNQTVRVDLTTFAHTMAMGSETSNFGILAGNVSIAGGEFTGEAGSNTLDTDGAIAITGGTLTAAGGAFGTESGTPGVANNDAAFTVSGTGTLAFTANTVAASVSNEGGTVTIGDAMNQTVRVDLTTFTQTMAMGSETTNSGILSGQIAINGGTFTAASGSNTLDTDGAITIAGGTVTAAGGAFGTEDGMTGNANNDAVFTVDAGGTLDVTGATTATTVDNQGGTVTVATGQTLTADLNSLVDPSMMPTDSTSTITGTLAGNLDVQSGTVTVTGRVTDDDTSVTGGALVSNGGSFGTVMTTGTVSVDGGTMTIGTGTTTANAEVDGGTLTVNGALDGTAELTTGTLTNSDGASISGETTVADGIVNAQGGAFTGGLVLNGGTVNITANTTGAITNNAVNPLTIGDFDITGNFTQGAGVTNNAGDIIGELNFSGAGTFNHNTNGSISQAATVDQGTLNANGGSFDGGLTVGGTATVDITANTTGDISNGRVLNGMIPALDGIANLQIANGVTVLGNVTNAQGAASGMTVNGTVDGELAVNAGTVTVNSTGSVTEATNVNGGTLNSEGGTFGTDDPATNVVTVTGVTSTLNVTGAGVTTTGNVVSAQGNVDIAEDAILDGNVTINDVIAGDDAGLVTNDGIIRGTLTVNDGTFTAEDGSTVEGVATASDGTLNLAGGDFTAGLTVSGDVDVVITAETEADITNNGLTGAMGVAGLENDQVIIGDFTQQAGDTENTGELRGETTVTGGTLTNGANGQLTGVANVTGGFLNNNATASITGKTTVSGASAIAEGTVTAAGGAFGDGASPVTGPFNDVDIEVQEHGNLNVTGSTSADVSNTGGEVDIATNQQLIGNFISNSDTADTVVNGQILGNVTLSDGQITLKTGAGFDDGLGGGSDGFGVEGDVTATSGTLVIEDGTTVSGGVALSGDAVLDTNGTTTINFVNNGTTLNFDAADVVNGSVTTNAGTTTNAGGTINGNIIVTQNVAIPPSVFNNTGTTTSDSVSVSAGTLNNNTNGVMNSDQFAVSGGQLVANGGTFANKDLTTPATVAVTSDGEFQVDEATTVNVTNTDDGIVDINAQLTGTLGNSGDGRVEVDARVVGVVTNSGDGVINANDGASFSETVLNNGGDVNIRGGVTGNVTNNGGDLTVNTNQQLTGNVRNEDTDSSVTVNTGAEIEGTLTVTDGSVTNRGTIDGATTVSTGTVNNIGNGTAGNGFLDGTVAVSGTGELSDTNGRISGIVTQTGGEVNANGTTFDMTVANNGGQMTTRGATSGDVNSNGGDLTVATGTLTGDVNVQNAASSVLNQATITGDVDLTAGSINNQGTINGDIVALSTGTSNPTTVTTSGTINGTVQLGATLAPGALSAPSTVANGALLEADAGNIVGLVTNNGGTVEANGATFDDGIQNNLGDVNINAATTVTGTIENAGGTLTVDDTLTTTVNQSAGATENNATIAGPVNITGGTVEQNAGSDTTGLTTLDSGTLEANGGDFTGGILTTGGTLTITADTNADIENDGANLVLPAGQVITGDFDNTSGTASLNGTMNGTVNIDDGIVNTVGSTTVTGTTNLRGGALVATGGTFDGRINSFDGALTIAGDTSVAGDVVNRGADVTVDATLTGNLNQQSGTSTNTGTIDGNLIVADGTSTNAGTVTGQANVSGGTLTTQAGSLITGRAAVSGGTLEAQGGTVTGGIRNDGGTVNVTGAVTADAQNITGTLNLDGASAVLTGDITNGGTLNSVDGTATGALSNSGTVNVTDGDLNVNSFGNLGTINVTGGNTLTATATGSIASTGTLVIDDGTVATDLTAADGSTLTLNEATVVGDFVSNTALAPLGGLTVTGDLSVGSTGSFVLNEGALDVGGVFDLAADTANRLETNTTVTATQINNNGTLTAVGDTRINGAFLNAGTVNMANAITGGATRAELDFDGEVTNTGTINGEGNIIFRGGLDNQGTLDLTGNEATTDRVLISGTGLHGSGELRFDLDLTETNASADRITLTEGAFVTGQVNLSFNVIGTGGEQDVDLVLIDIADNDPGDFTLTPVDIVDPSGILSYSLARNADGDVVIEDGLNPGIAGLAGNIVLTQSLIGSVVNRPSSPFVSGLAYEDEDPCGYGVWGRAIGGIADSTGSVTQGDTEGRAFDGTISADYAGIQLGGDYACFNGVINGWDLAIGGIFGVNSGSTSQPVFAINTEADTNFSNLQTSTTSVDFDQLYAGVYATAVNGPVAIDLQYRLENTDFSATNVGAFVNGVQLPGLGLNNTEFGSEATTLSGAVSYFYNIPESDLTFVPTAGFAYTQISTDPINFANRGVVRIDDFDSQIGFVGGTIAKSSFGDDGVSANRYFVSGTVYSDFADGPDSVFTPVDGSGDRSLGSDNLGTYGELSAGWNFVRILQPGELGDIKQLSSSVRVDARYSDRLDSYGVTAQMRLQF